jgi:enoyl-CoA hydratase
MADETYQTLEVSRGHEGHVVTVVLNRPEVHNAMNTAMGEDLVACFKAIASNARARTVVLTGTGQKAFCVGGDLKERLGMTDEQWRAQHVIFEHASWGILHCPIPVIAAVEGFAMGGGCELALAADFIVASETAVFALTETTLGIFPGIGGPLFMPRAIGRQLAKELIFTGRRMPAAEAKTAGMVNHVVPAGEARKKAEEIAAAIAKNGPLAVRQVKKVINRGIETDLETAFILALEAYNICVQSQDRSEGVRAFNEKRPPRYTGR